MSRSPSLSVVIPAYREAENILSTLENVASALSPLAIPHEILVVDDGSDDGTGTIVAEQLARFPALRLLVNPRNMGFGSSYRRGVEAAACDHIVMVHGDNAWGAETLRDFFSHLGEADVIVGYTRDMWRSRSWQRAIVSKTFTRLVNLITGRRLQYYNGLQIHQAAVLRSLRIESRGYGFQAEVLVKALHAGATFSEIPVDLIERMHGESQAFRLKNLADVARTLALLFALQRRTPASGASPAREAGL